MMGESSDTPETSASEAPPPDTAEAPAADTTAPQGATPTVSDVSVTVQPDDNAEHHPNSVQVPKDAVLTLNWSTSNAAGVRIDPLGSFGPSGYQQISTEDATFTLVPLGDDGVEGPSWPLDIHTHDPSEVVSPHADVTSGEAKIVSFQAMIGGTQVDTAKVGDTIELVLLASDGCESAKINDKNVDLADTADGHKTASSTLILTADMSGSFSADVSKGGDVADTGSASVAIEPPPAPQPALTSDAQSPQPAGAAFNLNWTIQNWAQGMTASISCDQDIGDGNGTNPQDVTGSVQDDGTGSMAINPPSDGAFKDGSFNYLLTVKPQSGDEVQSPALAVTIEAAKPEVTLTTDAQNPQSAGTAFNLTWTIKNWAKGMTASISCDQDIGDGNGTNPQDVTGSVQDDGTGSLAINPPSDGAFKDGSFNYVLTVTPQSGDPVQSPALPVTIQAPPKIVTFSAAAASAPGEGKLKLTWRIEGDFAQVQLDVSPPPAGTDSPIDVTQASQVSGDVDFDAPVPAAPPNATGTVTYKLLVSATQGATPIESSPIQVAIEAAADADSEDKPADDPAQFVFDAKEKKFSVKFGMRAYRALMAWELKQDGDNVTGCYYSEDLPDGPRVWKTYEKIMNKLVHDPWRTDAGHTNYVNGNEWPDMTLVPGWSIAADAELDRATEAPAGPKFKKYYFFYGNWLGTNFTNCCNSQLAAFAVALREKRIRLKTSGGNKVYRMGAGSDPQAASTDQNYPTAEGSISYRQLFHTVFVGSNGNHVSGSSTTKLHDHDSYGDITDALKLMGIGGPIPAKTSANADYDGSYIAVQQQSVLNAVRIGDWMCKKTHVVMVGDVRYQINFQGGESRFCHQSAFVGKGFDLQKLPLYADEADANKNGPLLDEGGVSWLMGNEDKLEKRLKDFLALAGQSGTLAVDGATPKVLEIKVWGFQVFSANAYWNSKTRSCHGKIYYRAPGGVNSEAGWKAETAAQRQSELSKHGLAFYGVSRRWEEMKDRYSFSRCYDHA